MKIKDMEEFNFEGMDVSEVLDFVDNAHSAVQKYIKNLSGDQKLAVISIVSDEIGGDVRSYSGRGMMGKTCVAIYCESGDTDDIISTAERYGIKNARTDNMGLDMVVYWPNIEYSEE